MSIEYKKLTQREHVLLRPETYIGTTSQLEETMFVVEDINDINNTNIIKKSIRSSPGFIKIFDEVLVNATDHFIRTNKVKNIRIYLNKDEGYIRILNDGPGIPIKKNSDGVWIPEMIFLNFLSGSNFDDTKERYTGGRNGIGIKATATFSTEFDIEIADGVKSYYQKCSNNLLDISEPKIKKLAKKDEYVSITYWPDLEKFKMTEISNDDIALIMRRILESCVYCNKKVNIYFNDLLIDIKSTDYFKRMTNTEEIFKEEINGWEVYVSKSPTDQFEHSSIVNGISTYNGGTHVNWASLNISKSLSELFPKKYNVSWTEIKNNLFIFMICKVVNPTFNSQSKDQLTNYIGKDILKDSTNFSVKFIKSIYNSEIVKSIIEKIELREKMELSKLQKQTKVKVEKLVDANNKNRNECELHIFEGDSAGQPMRNYKTQNQGFFCLRGKFMNVSNVDAKKIVENKEAFGLMQSIGLKWNEKFDKKNIRYCKIIIATDADVDGDSITGQLLNFFSNWPELFELGMIYRNITPLLVVEDKKSKTEKCFYSQREYDLFSKTDFDEKRHTVSYKKGIGSLEPHQFKEIIRNPLLHRYSLTDDSLQKLDIWFGKDSDLRKNELLK